MPSPTLPIAKSLYLCDYHFGYENGKVDLYGIFNAIQPESYPHRQERFCVFAQLTDAEGKIPFVVDIRGVLEEFPVHTTKLNELVFESRTEIVQLALQIENCTFPNPGEFVVELFCNGHWICDAPFVLLDPR